MEDLIKKNTTVLFITERLLTNLQELHYNKLLHFLNCKNMIDLEVSFLDYCVKEYLKKEKEEINRLRENVLKNDEDYILYIEISYKEFIENFEKQYNQFFRRGNYVKNNK